jgi:hypothetical protein
MLRSRVDIQVISPMKMPILLSMMALRLSFKEFCQVEKLHHSAEESAKHGNDHHYN